MDVEYFAEESGLCVVTAGNVKVRELSLQGPELQRSFVHRTCSSKNDLPPSPRPGAVFILCFSVIDLHSVNGNICFTKKVRSRKAVSG